MRYNLLHSGVSFYHEKGYIADYPEGRDWIQFYVFDDPIKVWTAKGFEETTGPTALITRPGTRIWQGGIDLGEWVNDWFFLDPKGMEEFCNVHYLPLDTLIPLVDTVPLKHLIRRFQEEQSAQRPFWQEMVHGLIIEFGVLLARACHQGQTTPSKNPSAIHTESLRRLRAKMRADISKRWTLQQMAQLTGLSTSRLCTLYKAIFHVSPIEDLIAHKMEQAKILLGNRQTSVKAVALHLGFSNQQYFSRMFRKRFGRAPSELAG
ncbi:MAG: AraC family transcriptional regulator [Verrucomicrobiota bacterium]|nr:AraC family transcriptional regulator [Verrucomicrobiota bacterium]